MKRRLAILILLALIFSLPAGVQAAGFPPKTLAFSWQGTSYTVLSLKANGKVQMAPGVVTFYLLTGICFQTGNWFCPVTGTGFLHPNGSFYFSLEGDVPYQGTGSSQFHGYLLPEGTGHGYRRTISDTPEPWASLDLTIVPANTLTPPGF